jgi:acyl-CoA synthetase (AMP-forming)/AMP-acid ligase II
LECYFGIPAAGGVMHTLNLRLSPDEIAWIANDAQDRFLNFQVTSMDWLALSKDGHRRARLTPYGVLNWLVL